MPRHHRLTISLIALIAISWAQAFGLQRGYLCDCGGVENLTQVDHCHGPHSTACHDVEDHDIPHQHDETDEDTHQHAAVIDSLLAKQQSTVGFDIVAPSLAVIAEITWDIAPQRYSTPLVLVNRSHKPPDWPQRLSQTIALRI